MTGYICASQYVRNTSQLEFIALSFRVKSYVECCRAILFHIESQITKSCRECGAISENRCSTCTHYYCSNECLKNDHHKSMCYSYKDLLSSPIYEKIAKAYHVHESSEDTDEPYVLFIVSDVSAKEIASIPVEKESNERNTSLGIIHSELHRYQKHNNNRFTILITFDINTYQQHLLSLSLDRESNLRINNLTKI